MGGSGICGVGEVLGALAAPLSRQWVVREGGRFSTCWVNCERKMTHVVDRGQLVDGGSSHFASLFFYALFCRYALCLVRPT